MSNPNKKDELLEVSYGTPTLNDWKMYFRNLQQAPEVHREVSPESSEESSFELEESFRVLLDRKRQQLDRARTENMLSEEESAKIREEIEATSNSKVIPGNDSTFFEQDSISKISDTSFEEMEKICAVLDKVNRFESDVSVSAACQQPVEKQATVVPTTFADITQLEDVDEPSGFWENTLLPGSGQMLSPVKRMHLLRPSTIIEESTINEAGGSKNSSIESYLSARQTASQEVESRNSAISGSEVYRTAEETFATDSYARSSVMDSGLVYDNTSSENPTSYEHQQQHDEESEYSKNSTAEVGRTDEQQNVIILDSSNSEVESDVEERQDPRDLPDSLQFQHSEHDESILEDGQPQTLIDFEESADDCSNMSGLEEMPERFNDTLEETDFMLKQGMKLMAMKNTKELQKQRSEHEESELWKSLDKQPQQKSRTNSESDDGATYIRTMMRTPVEKETPSGVMRSKLNVSLGVVGGSKQTLFSSAGKYNVAKKYPAPPSGGTTLSGGAFKKPAVSRLPLLRPGRKFDHIVSPIGAYIKKTPQSMLQSKINCPNKNLIDVLHNESRDSVMSNRGSKENYHAETGGAVNAKGYIPSLPGKGVISSNRAHVLDERNHLRIPGGEKMQKLINNSPSLVIRHEGRIRYTGESGGAVRKLMMDNNTIGDDSLKDISVASNDVSVRVLHDAKRF